MDERLAEFIGIFIGDGSLHSRPNKHAYEFKITGNPTDEEPYYKFVSKLAAEITGKPTRIKRLDCGRSIGVRFCSTKLYLELKALVKGEPQEMKRQIPAAALSTAGNTIACLRGLFDTDGTFTLKRRYRTTQYYPAVGFSQKNANVVLQASAALDKLQIPHCKCINLTKTDPRTGKPSNYSRIDIYGKKRVATWFETIGSHNPKISRRYAQYVQGNA